MPGFDNGVVFADNVDFSGSGVSTGNASVLLNGQLLIGSTVAPHIRVATLTSTGGTVAITNGAGTINLELSGGAAAVEHLTGTTGGQLNPTANNFNLLAGTVAAGTTPVQINGSGSTLTTNIQISQALAAADATKIGLSNFDSSSFTVAATGFVTLLTTGVLKTLTGNSGGAISPTANNINTLGTGSITIAGSGSTLTTQLTGLTNHALQVGAGTATLTQLATTATVGQVLQSAGASADPAYSTATYPLTTTINQILYSSSANTVVGLATANQGVLTTGATGIPVITALATNGQLIIGSTAGVPAAANITSSDSSVTVTNGSNSISLTVSGGTTVGKTITGDSGGALSPTAGNWNIVGSGSTVTSGSVSTLTIALQNLTNHAVLVGAGTATITKIAATATTGQIFQNNASADPSWSTATYPSSTTVSQILYSSATNVVSGLATANSATLVTTSTGVPVLSSSMTNGQMIIGSTSATPVVGTITSTGGTITVTVGAGTLNLEVAAGGFTWVDATSATQALAIETGYVTDRSAGVVYTLPASATLGQEIKIVGKLGITTITPNANQQIVMSSASGTVGATGTAVGTNVGDCIDLICITAGASTVWRSNHWVGNWTLS